MRRQNWEIVVKCSVVHTTAKQVISRRQKDENSYEMYKNEKCMCKACKTMVTSLSNMVICDVPVAIFMVALLQIISSRWKFQAYQLV